MKKKLHLIMPMGGAGSRFLKNGFEMPKPLIKINEKPFLYWATRSIEKYVDVADITYVVLEQHIAEFHIDEVILNYFPTARIEAVEFEKVKSGPVMTCLVGLKNIQDNQPILFNDCDHMFSCSSFAEDMNTGLWDYDGALLTFESNHPQFSYIKYENEKVIGTVEKRVVSNYAICGAYMIRNAQLFREMAEEYSKNCNYNEFFVSGIYNIMCQKRLDIQNYIVDFHVPFGTPVEYEMAQKSDCFKLLE
ncbi:NTP transferase domain-containing protein [Blautia schinkii]|nr:NTP transferase domain-containing protein [Blautia schinkii]